MILTIWQKIQLAIGLYLDEKFERTEELNCAWCKKPIKEYKTILKIYGREGLCCSDWHAKLYLRHG